MTRPYSNAGIVRVRISTPEGLAEVFQLNPLVQTASYAMFSTTDSTYTADVSAYSVMSVRTVVGPIPAQLVPSLTPGDAVHPIHFDPGQASTMATVKAVAGRPISFSATFRSASEGRVVASIYDPGGSHTGGFFALSQKPPHRFLWMPKKTGTHRILFRRAATDFSGDFNITPTYPPLSPTKLNGATVNVSISSSRPAFVPFVAAGGQYVAVRLSRKAGSTSSADAVISLPGWDVTPDNPRTPVLGGKQTSGVTFFANGATPGMNGVWIFSSAPTNKPETVKVGLSTVGDRSFLVPTSAKDLPCTYHTTPNGLGFVRLHSGGSDPV